MMMRKGTFKITMIVALIKLLSKCLHAIRSTKPSKSITSLVTRDPMLKFLLPGFLILARRWAPIATLDQFSLQIATIIIKQ